MPAGFAPVIDTHTEVLLIGTLPGSISLEKHQYYANPQNQFWTILENICGKVMPTDYGERCTYLLERKVGIWDVLESADREGTTDRGITNPRINDFSKLLQDFPSIKRVVILGSTAKKYYKRGIAQGRIPRSLEYSVVQSSSSLPGRNVLPLSEKVEQWKKALFENQVNANLMHLAEELVKSGG